MPNVANNPAMLSVVMLNVMAPRNAFLLIDLIIYFEEKVFKTK
jgi:hypothetical protein